MKDKKIAFGILSAFLLLLVLALPPLFAVQDMKNITYTVSPIISEIENLSTDSVLEGNFHLGGMIL